MSPLTSIPEWLFTLAGVSTGAVGLMWIATLLLRRKSAALRHFFWLLALSAPLLALPMSLMHARIAIPILAHSLEQVSTHDLASQSEIAPPSSAFNNGDQISAAATPALSTTPAARHGFVLPFNPWITVWFFGVVGIILRILFSQLRLRRLIQDGCSPGPATLILFLNRTKQHFKLKRSVRLMVTPLTEIPFCHGVFNPTVIFPDSWQKWDDQRIEVCLTHELAHIIRGDLLALALAQVTCILCWFNPLVWLAASRLRDEAENAADDLVLAKNIRPETYAANLVAITEKYRASALSPTIALSMARPNRLKSRVEAILDSTLVRKAPSFQVTFCTGLLAACILIGGISVRLTAAPAPAVASTAPSITNTPTADQKDAIANAIANTPDNPSLKSISLSDLNFEGADIRTVLPVLAAKSKEINTKKGLHFVLRLFFPGDDGRKTAVSVDPRIHTLVTLKGAKMSLGDILDSLSAQTGLEHEVDPGGPIYFFPPVETSDTFAVCTYSIPPNFITGSYPAVSPAPGGDSSSSVEARKVDVKGELLARGLLFPDGAAATFYPTSKLPIMGGKLVVRDTITQLDLLSLLLDHMSQDDRQPVENKLDAEDLALISEARSTPFEYAAFDKAPPHNILAEVEHLLEQGANPNAKDVSGNTALSWALNYGSDDVATALIEHGADFNTGNQYDPNAAWIAAWMFYCPNALELMIKKGVNVKDRDKGGATILHHMEMASPLGPSHPSYFNGVPYSEALQEDYEARERRTVDLLAAAGVDLNARDNSQGADGSRTPLMTLLRSHHLAAARALIDHGADLTLKDAGGNIALASLFNWSGTGPIPTDIVESMLAHGVDPNATVIPLGDGPSDAMPALELALTNCPKRTPEDTAALRKTIGLFLKHGALFPKVSDDKVQALLQVAAQGDLKSMQDIILQGTAINSSDGPGWTALTLSIALSFTDCAQWLLAQGADTTVHAKWDCNSALALAVATGQANLVDALIAKGPKPNPDATKVLWFAVENKDQRVFDALIKAGANAKSVNILSCIKNGAVAMAKTALDAGADPNHDQYMPNNQNLAFWAVHDNQPEILKALLDHGADPSPKNSQGETALSHAQEFHPELVPILESHVK